MTMMTAKTAKIVIYDKIDFGGASRELTQTEANLKAIGFDDRATSIKVVGSVWIGYQYIDFKGLQFILEEGEYANWNVWHGSWDNQLSSLKKLDQDIGETPQITLYQNADYGGRALNVTHDINDLTYYSFNDTASSLKVKSGIWILYQHVNFTEKQWIVTEGSYPNWKSWKSDCDDQITSLRPVKEPFFPTEVLSMEFDIAKGLLNTTPVALVNLSQSNASSSDQAASWSTKRTITTTKKFEFHWENSTAVSVSATFKAGVPGIAENEITIGLENTFAIGENKGEENTQSDEWGFQLPATVKANTHLRVQVNIQQGKIDVPFSALLQKGNRRWREVGTYKGTQSYNLHVDYKETPL